jgi:hypothetical protein
MINPMGDRSTKDEVDYRSPATETVNEKHQEFDFNAYLSPPSLAKLILSNPSQKDRLIAAAHRTHGNSFVQHVVRLLHKTPSVTETSTPHKTLKTDTASAIDTKPTLSPRQRTAGWEQVARSQLDNTHAPSEISLPGTIVEAIDKAWTDSNTGENEKEQGGNIVRTYGGRYEMRREPGYDSGEFDPNLNDVGFGNTLVGDFHTHPYGTAKERASGAEYGTFSSADVASLTQEDQPLTFLRSGPYTFVIAKTKQFRSLVDKHEANDTLLELSAEIFSLHERVFNETPGSLASRLETSVIRVCEKYQLIYYEGRGKELHRADKPRI